MYLFIFAFLGNFFYVLSILTSSKMDLPAPLARQFIRDSIPYVQLPFVLIALLYPHRYLHTDSFWVLVEPSSSILPLFSRVSYMILGDELCAAGSDERVWGRWVGKNRGCYYRRVSKKLVDDDDDGDKLMGGFGTCRCFCLFMRCSVFRIALRVCVNSQ